MKPAWSKKLLSLAVSAVLTVGMLSMATFAEGNSETVIKLFHTNDVHSRYDASVNEDGTLGSFGYARLKTLIDSNSGGADGVLVFDAGDVFHGQPFATLNRGSSISALMKAVGYNAMVAGNHDFNYGYRRTPTLAYLAQTKLLGANVLKKSDGTIADGFAEYQFYNVDGVKIGVFGLSTPETAYKTNTKNVDAIQFADPVKTAKQVVKKLREKQADVVVCLAHLGIDEASGKNTSTYLAQNVDGIDLIIDGHSHSTPDSYQKVNDTVITSAGEYMEYVGMATIEVGADKKVSVKADAFKASDFKADALKPDAKVQTMIDRVKKAQEPRLNTVVASAPEVLNGERENVRTGETNLSRLVASAMLAESGADIAMTNGGGIRASIDAGPITVGEVQTVLPFGNYIVTVQLTGKEVREAVEHGLPGLANGKLEVIGNKIQAAGLEVTYDPSKPAGSRIVTITHNGEKLVDSKTYLVATNDFMAAGGDDYTMLNKKVINEFSALDEAVIHYLNKNGSKAITEISKESRIVRI